MEKLIQYFTQVAHLSKKGTLTAQDIRDAAAATGDVSDIIGAVLAHASAYGVNPEKELTDLYRAQSAAKRTAEERKYKETLLEKLTGIIASINTATRKELADALSAAALSATGHTADACITAEELMSKTYPPRQEIVEKLITPGLTILSGAPKIGKSWLMLSLAEAVSCGGNFLSEFKTAKAGVLHLALEETERSIYERRRSLRFFPGSDSISIATQWNSGVEGIYGYVKERPDIKLVIIDTLGRFMPEIEDMNDYAGTVRALSHLKRTADELDVAVVAVHHAKKGWQSEKTKGDWMDSSLGSQGIVGTADATLVLQRDINKESGERTNTGRLYGTGRNIRDTFRALKFDPDVGSWIVDGAEDANAVKKEGGTKNVRNAYKDRAYGT